MHNAAQLIRAGAGAVKLEGGRKRLSHVEAIVDAEIPGVRPWQLIDAAACLWTTRRIASRAMTRIPEDPEWDETGLRMELVR